MTYIPNLATFVSTSNSTTTPLASSATFTGDWEDVARYNSVIVAAKTDLNGTFTVQFSPDGTNIDSTLTRYYRTNQIEAPHRFTITRRYVRVTFTNTASATQGLFRLQTTFGEKSDLNSPVDSILSQDFDATVTRPTDFLYESALGRRQGYKDWSKFGYNPDVDTGTELVWSFGGLHTIMTTARTLSVVSTDSTDDLGNTGAQYVIVYGIDANREAQTVVVEMNGTTPVVTTETWFGINRMSIYLCGTNTSNAGVITATATTDLTVQGQIPIGDGSSQACLFYTQANHQALIKYAAFNAYRISGGGSPRVTIKCWVYSFISQAKYQIIRKTIDTAVENVFSLELSIPLQVGESSVIWFEATTTLDNTEVSGRFSLVEVRDVDA